jgi:hypothetical protein
MKPEQAAKSGSEHGEQVALFIWAQTLWAREPRLKLMFAIPNGGLRDKITAARLKAEGVKSGVPDIMLPVQSRGFAGLFIELKKAKGGVVSDAQTSWKDDLTAQGYFVAVCYGWTDAMECIQWYLDKKLTT